jgi:hypothetical protein
MTNDPENDGALAVWMNRGMENSIRDVNTLRELVPVHLLSSIQVHCNYSVTKSISALIPHSNPSIFSFGLTLTR